MLLYASHLVFRKHETSRISPDQHGILLKGFVCEVQTFAAQNARIQQHLAPTADQHDIIFQPSLCPVSVYDGWMPSHNVQAAYSWCNLALQTMSHAEHAEQLTSAVYSIHCCVFQDSDCPFAAHACNCAQIHPAKALPAKHTMAEAVAYPANDAGDGQLMPFNNLKVVGLLIKDKFGHWHLSAPACIPTQALKQPKYSYKLEFNGCDNAHLK